MLKIDNYIIWIGLCQTIAKRLGIDDKPFMVHKDADVNKSELALYFKDKNKWSKQRSETHGLSEEGLKILNKLESVYNAEKQISFVDVFHCCMYFRKDLNPDKCVQAVDDLFQEMLKYASPEMPMFNTVIAVSPHKDKTEAMSDIAIKQSYGNVSYNDKAGINVFGLLKAVVDNHITDWSATVTSEYKEGDDGKAYAQLTVDTTENQNISDKRIGDILNEAKTLDSLYNCSNLGISIVDFIFMGSEIYDGKINLNGSENEHIKSIYYETLCNIKNLYDKPLSNDLEMVGKFITTTAQTYLSKFADKTKWYRSYLEDFVDFVFISVIKEALKDATNSIVVSSDRTQNRRGVELTTEMAREILAITANDSRGVFFFQSGLEKLKYTLKVYKDLYELKLLFKEAKLDPGKIIFICKEWKPENQFIRDICVSDIYGDKDQKPLTREAISAYIKVDLNYRRNNGLPEYNINPIGLKQIAALDNFIETHNPDSTVDIFRKIVSTTIESKIQQDIDNDSSFNKETSKEGTGNIFAYDLTSYICLKYVCNIVFTRLFKANFDSEGAWLPYQFSFGEYNEKLEAKQLSCTDLSTMLLGVLINWSNRDMLNIFALVLQLFQDEVLSAVSETASQQYNDQVLAFASIMNNTLCKLLNLHDNGLSKHYYGTQAINDTVYKIFKTRDISVGNSQHIRQSLQRFLQSGLTDWRALFDTARKRLDALDPDKRLEGLYQFEGKEEWDVPGPNQKISKYKCQELQPSCRIFATNWDPLNSSIAFTATDTHCIHSSDFNREHNLYSSQCPLPGYQYELSHSEEDPEKQDKLNEKLDFVRDYPFAMFNTQNGTFKKFLGNDVNIGTVEAFPKVTEVTFENFDLNGSETISEDNKPLDINTASVSRYDYPDKKGNNLCSLANRALLNGDIITLHVLGHEELLSQSDMCANVIDYGDLNGFYVQNNRNVTRDIKFYPILAYVGGHKFVYIKDHERRAEIAKLLRESYERDGNTYKRIQPQLPANLLNHFMWKSSHDNSINKIVILPMLKESYNNLMKLPIKTNEIDPTLLTANFTPQLEQHEEEASNTAISLRDANTGLAISQASDGNTRVMLNLNPFKLKSEDEYVEGLKQTISFTSKALPAMKGDIPFELGIDEILPTTVEVIAKNTSNEEVEKAKTISEIKAILNLSNEVKKVIEDLDLKKSEYLSPILYSASPSVLLGRGSLQYLSYIAPGGGAPFFHELTNSSQDVKEVLDPVRDKFTFVHRGYSDVAFTPPETYSCGLKESEVFVRDVYTGLFNLKALETKMVISADDFLNLFLEIMSINSINFIEKDPNTDSDFILSKYKFDVSSAIQAYAKSITEMRNRISLQRASFIRFVVSKANEPTTKQTKDQVKDSIILTYTDLGKDEVLFNSSTAIDAFKSMQDEQLVSNFKCKHPFTKSSALPLGSMETSLQELIDTEVSIVTEEHNKIIEQIYNISEPVRFKYNSNSYIPKNSVKYKSSGEHIDTLLNALEKAFKENPNLKAELASIRTTDTVYTNNATYRSFEGGPELQCWDNSPTRDKIKYLAKGELHSISNLIPNAGCELYVVLLDSGFPLVLICTDHPSASLLDINFHEDIFDLFKKQYEH